MSEKAAQTRGQVLPRAVAVSAEGSSWKGDEGSPSVWLLEAPMVTQNTAKGKLSSGDILQLPLGHQSTGQAEDVSNQLSSTVG